MVAAGGAVIGSYEMYNDGGNGGQGGLSINTIAVTAGSSFSLTVGKRGSGGL